MTCLLQTLRNYISDKDWSNWNSTGSSPGLTPADFPSRVVWREGWQESSIPNFVCSNSFCFSSICLLLLRGKHIARFTFLFSGPMSTNKNKLFSIAHPKRVGKWNYMHLNFSISRYGYSYIYFIYLKCSFNSTQNFMLCHHYRVKHKQMADSR